MTVEWRKPTVEELHAWLQCRPRVGKLLWRKTVKRSKTAWHQPYRNRERVWSRNGEPSERGVWQKTVGGKLQADATPYPAGSSAIIKDRYAELIVIIPGLKRVRAHHAIWAMVHGEWPKGRLLFKDGDKRNIAIHNLAQDSQAARDRRAVKASVKGKLKSLKLPSRYEIRAVVEAALPMPDQTTASRRAARTSASIMLASFLAGRAEERREAVEREIERGVKRSEVVGAAAYRQARQGSSVEQFMRRAPKKSA